MPDGSEAEAALPPVTIEPGELAELVLGAPPMRGGAEFLTPNLLGTLWRDLDARVEQEAEECDGLSAWLQARHPQWHAMGRVTFHLAENRRDGARPTAFLATYTHGISAGGRAQHLPLARALQEYAGAKNKAALARLLAPVQRAPEGSTLARELIASHLPACSCLDHADLCKHVAATLYGVGARLDEHPETLFLLRGVNYLELIAATGSLQAELASQADGTVGTLDKASSALGPEPTARRVKAPRPAKKPGKNTMHPKAASTACTARPSKMVESTKRNTRKPAIRAVGQAMQPKKKATRVTVKKLK